MTSGVFLSSPKYTGASFRGPGSFWNTAGIYRSFSGLIKQTHSSRQNREVGPGPRGLTRSLWKQEAPADLFPTSASRPGASAPCRTPCGRCSRGLPGTSPNHRDLVSVCCRTSGSSAGTGSGPLALESRQRHSEPAVLRGPLRGPCPLAVTVGTCPWGLSQHRGERHSPHGARNLDPTQGAFFGGELWWGQKSQQGQRALQCAELFPRVCASLSSPRQGLTPTARPPPPTCQSQVLGCHLCFDGPAVAQGSHRPVLGLDDFLEWLQNPRRQSTLESRCITKVVGAARGTGPQGAAWGGQGASVPSRTPSSGSGGGSLTRAPAGRMGAGAAVSRF